MQTRVLRRLHFVAAITFFAASFSLFAQEAPPPPLPPPPPPGQVSVMGPRMFFFNREIGNHRVVTGKPYSADETTTTTQVLADGNRIVHTEHSQLVRDSQGRTRRDHALAEIGPWSVKGKPPEVVEINDPVAGVRYMLNVQNKTATEWSPPPRPKGAMAGAANPKENYAYAVTTNGESSATMVFKTRRPKANFQTNSESLGNRIIEGVLAQGTRTTTTIPAGAIGNEKPIIVSDERWYAPALERDVLTKHTDPRFGETESKLTNLRLQEPDESLFQVPPDYTVRQDKGKFTMQLPDAPPKP